MLEPPFLMRIAHAELVDFCTRCLRRGDAELTAKLLVDADARGVYTHGTASLRRYVPLTALTVDSLKGLSADVRVDGPF